MFQAKGVPQGKHLPWRSNQGEAVNVPLQKDGFDSRPY